MTLFLPQLKITIGGDVRRTEGVVLRQSNTSPIHKAGIFVTEYNSPIPKLLILSSDTDDYRKLIERADLPNLEIVTEPAGCDIFLWLHQK